MDIKDFNAACNEISQLHMITTNQETLIASLAAELATAKAERDALASWSCQSCGAIFPKKSHPIEIEGVTHCSKCFEVNALAAQLNKWAAAVCDYIPVNQRRDPTNPAECVARAVKALESSRDEWKAKFEEAHNALEITMLTWKYSQKDGVKHGPRLFGLLRKHPTNISGESVEQQVDRIIESALAKGTR